MTIHSASYKVPKDVFEHNIFPNLENTTIANLSKVSKFFQKMASSDELWTRLAQNYFQITISQGKKFNFSKKSFQNWYEGEYLKGVLEISNQPYPTTELRGMRSFGDIIPLDRQRTAKGSLMAKFISSESIQITDFWTKEHEIYILDKKFTNSEFNSREFLFGSHSLNHIAFTSTYFESFCLIYNRKTQQFINNIDVREFGSLPKAQIINESLIAIYNSSKIKIYNFNTNEVFQEYLFQKKIFVQILQIDLFKEQIFLQRKDSFDNHSDYETNVTKEMIKIDIKTKKIETFDPQNNNFYFLNGKMFKYVLNDNGISFYHSNKNLQENWKLRSHFNLYLNEAPHLKFEPIFRGNLCVIYRTNEKTLFVLKLDTQEIVFKKNLNFLTKLFELRLSEDKILIMGVCEKSTGMFSYVLNFKMPENKTENNNNEKFANVSKNKESNSIFQIFINKIYFTAKLLFIKIKELFVKIVQSVSNLKKHVFTYFKNKLSF